MKVKERYQRQVSLKGFGITSQEKLCAAKVFIAGMGGLGCPASLYLAAAGTGTIAIADNDTVSLSNLHRQVLFTAGDIGKPKVLVAEKKLKLLNPEVNIISYPVKLTNRNLLDIISEYDIIIDGTDNFPTKYLLNDACVLLNKPFIYGSVSRFEGQLAIFNVPDEKGLKCNYRDLFPGHPTDEILNCSEDGVLGVLTGIIGIMQANEAIKLLTGTGIPLINQLLIFNSLTSKSYILELSENKEAYHLPVNAAEFIKMDYDWLCRFENNVEEIDVVSFNRMLGENNVVFIDVREMEEKPDINFHHKKIPLSQFNDKIKIFSGDLSGKFRIVLFCQTGKRSLEAAKILLNTYDQTKKVYTLKGGILSLQN